MWHILSPNYINAKTNLHFRSPFELLPSLGVRRHRSYTFTFKSSSLKQLYQIKPNLAGMILDMPFQYYAVSHFTVA